MAKRIQQSERPNIIEEELNRLFSAEWLREAAKETGFVKRDRKIDPALMFWSLTLGFCVSASENVGKFATSSAKIKYRKILY
jgi:hypothetical protein